MNDGTLKTALATSLALNIFILGAAAGGWFWQPAPTPPQQAGQGLAAAAQALDPDQRQTFRQVVATARRDAQPDSQIAREERDKLANLLKAPNLDRGTIDSTLEMTRAADTRARARLEAAVVDFAESLDPQSRAILIEGLSSRGQMLPRDTKK
ncbi:periplasmic heavy metal sensor [Pleomorphomonas sp. PLEO]|uniref:periplasmic heavy metal sensor n=1 Tax=Pleomorphomonas sp. PLEO TaxID=3239306 RepID=UPI00351E21F4